MTDIKTVTRKASKRARTPKKGGRSGMFPRMELICKTQTWMFRSTLPPVLLNSGTTGTISSSSIGFSITQFSEYSALSALQSEIRLIAVRLVFTPKTQNLSATLQDTIMVGSRPDFNSTTPPTPPTGFQFVENLADAKSFGTYGVRPFIWYAKIQKGLQYTALNADAPTLPTEYAGSPGSVMIYAMNLSTSSVNYFSVVLSCIWQLRFRV
jgi:hypothetical protein